MKFNASLEMWSKPASKAAFPKLLVDQDGDVFGNREHIARFSNQEEAVKTLNEAGYTGRVKSSHPGVIVLVVPVTLN